MGEIEIVKNEGQVSYESIHELLYAAHSDNRENGFHVKTAELPAQELQAKLGSDGACFVAMDQETLVGVSAVRFVARKKWFGNMTVADQIFVGVHPSYRGRHVSTMLHKAIVEYSREKGISVIEIQTAYNNRNMQQACIKWGFYYMDFFALPKLDHYTVSMCKWIDGKAPNALKRWWHYQLKKWKTILAYKPGKLSRF